MERVATLEAAHADYAEDIAAWAGSQAALLRAGRFESIDVENIAEEIESLARSDRRALRSHLTVIIEHLLKLMFSPAADSRALWRTSVINARFAIRTITQESPSLKRDLEPLIASVHDGAAGLAETSMERHGETERNIQRRLLATRLNPDQILGDWFPDA